MKSRDEFFHVPGEEEFWNESYYFDFVGNSLQGHFRIGFYPNRQEANVFAFLVDNDTVYSAYDKSISLDRVHGLAVRRDDWEFVATPDEVGRAWTVEFEGEMTPGEPQAEDIASQDDRVEVDILFTSRGRHEPFLYSEGRDDASGEDEDRYEQATRVSGTANIGDDTYTFEAPGERDHSWGVRKWTDGEWLWISGCFEDGQAYNHLSAWPPGGDPVIVNGFWYDKDEVHPITEADLRATPPFSVETALEWFAEGAAPDITLDLEWETGKTSLAVEPFATTPVEWTDEDAGRRSVMNRSPARQIRDGTTQGRGFLENMTQIPLDNTPDDPSA